jgi:prephenate dehydrogenase
MPRPLHTVALLGTGLIGGSLGLALRARRPDLHVVGFDADAEEARRAEAAGALAAVAHSPRDAAAEADLVMLACPVSAAFALLDELAPALRPGTLVTDVGSVKAPVVAHARRVLPEAVPFCGGHPMAGAERGGIAHADPLLFENAAWVLCPPDPLDAEAFRTAFAPLLEMVEAVGARPLLLDAETHDRAVAAVSHLPQLLSVALAPEAADGAARLLAAGGFRDMTRIASSPFPLWREILSQNRQPALEALARLGCRVERLHDALATGDWAALGRAFEEAREAREGVPARSKGFLSPLAELTVRIEDRPGALLGVARALAEAGVDVRDIELLRVREGAEGAFRIGVSDEAEAERAAQVLRERGYDPRRRG